MTVLFPDVFTLSMTLIRIQYISYSCSFTKKYTLKLAATNPQYRDFSEAQQKGEVGEVEGQQSLEAKSHEGVGQQNGIGVEGEQNGEPANKKMKLMKRIEDALKQAEEDAKLLEELLKNN